MNLLLDDQSIWLKGQIELIKMFKKLWFLLMIKSEIKFCFQKANGYVTPNHPYLIGTPHILRFLLPPLCWISIFRAVLVNPLEHKFCSKTLNDWNKFMGCYKIRAKHAIISWVRWFYQKFYIGAIFGICF